MSEASEASESTGPTGRNWLGWVVIAAAIVMLAQALYSQHKLNQATDDRAREIKCLSAWAVKFGAALDARTSVSASTTDLRSQMDAASADVFFHVAPVLAAHPKPGDVNALLNALDHFRTAHDNLAKAVQKQTGVGAAHPYPDPPEGCVK